jgi:hypothetical protein
MKRVCAGMGVGSKVTAGSVANNRGKVIDTSVFKTTEKNLDSYLDMGFLRVTPTL